MGAAMTFEGKNCWGEMHTFFWNPLDQIGGQYNIDDMRKRSQRNNVMGSAMVPKGYLLELYNNFAFEAFSETIVGSYKFNDTNREELVCVNLKQLSTQSSLIVRRDPQASSAIDDNFPANGEGQALSAIENLLGDLVLGEDLLGDHV